jgi:hypothetical protein
MLEAQSQRVDSFLTVSSTPTAYYILFGLLGGANLASPLPSIPGLPLTDGFEFFKKESSGYSNLGLAYRTSTIPIIPAKYDNPDKYYQFPMTPGLTWSSTASFSISLPGVGFLSIQKLRNSIVDGWGTLVTPYGTFPTLRVKSTITEHDSIYADTLGFGFAINREITEYKWLGSGKGIPLLQVNEENGIPTARYRDIYRMSTEPLRIDLGPDTTVMAGTTITINAETGGGNPPYHYLWSTLDTTGAITVTLQESQTFVVLVYDAIQNFAIGQKSVTVTFPTGCAEVSPASPFIYPNPTTGVISVSHPGLSGPITIQVTGAGGHVEKVMSGLEAGALKNLDFSDLPPGLYFIAVTAGSERLTGKFVITCR